MDLARPFILSQEQFDALRQGIFVHHSHNLQLLDTNNLLFAGPGYIRRIEKGGKFDVILFNKREMPLAQRLELANRKYPAGQFIEDNYSLRIAEPQAPLIWKIEGINLLHNRFEVVIDPTILTFNTGHLVLERNAPIPTQVTTLSLWYQGNFKIPFDAPVEHHKQAGDFKAESRLVARMAIQWNGLELHLIQDGDYLMISITSPENKLPTHLDQRITETLQFVLGQPLNWEFQSIVAPHQQRVTVQKTLSPQTYAYPPLYWGFKHAQHFRGMFCRYFEHISSFKEQGFHPLSQIVTNVVRSTGPYFEPMALMLSVAIEGLLKNHILHRKKRISVETELQKLEKNGLVSPGQRLAWRNIRQKLAHGELPATLEQKTMNDFYQVLTLYYRLIFHIIRYAGPCTNYGTTDWLEENFNQPTDGPNVGSDGIPASVQSGESHV